jgi:hypothetical protein
MNHIEAMKQVRDELEKFAKGEGDGLPVVDLLAKLAAAIEQAEKCEPVVTKTENGMVLHEQWDRLPNGAKLFAAPTHYEYDPVGGFILSGSVYRQVSKEFENDQDVVKLYTHPAPAQPVSNQVIEKLDDLAAQPVPQGGWRQDGGLLYRLTDGKKPVNRDEINVTMADGFRTPEARARRAGELLDRIRSTSPAQPALKPLKDEQILKTANAIDGFIWHEGMASECGVLDVEAIQFARAIEAAHGIKGQS